MDKQRIFLLTYSAIFLVIMAETASAGRARSDRDIAHHLLTKAGTSRGLCSLLGCERGTLALELVRDSQFFLYVQDPRGATVAAAYKALDVDGLYGTRVLVERKPLDSLAFADNTVDVMLAPLGAKPAGQGTGVPHELKDLSINQIMRVLRPGGKAIIGTVRGAERQLTQKQLSQWILKHLTEETSFKFGKDAFGSWVEITKPQPKGTDSWSHWEHGPDNNPVSKDTAVLQGTKPSRKEVL